MFILEHSCLTMLCWFQIYCGCVGKPPMHIVIVRKPFHLTAVKNAGNVRVHMSLVSYFHFGCIPRLLHHMAVLFLIFQRISVSFSIVAVPTMETVNPLNSIEGFPFLHPKAVLTTFVFLIIAILPGMRRYLLGVLIGISLISDLDTFSSICQPFVFFLDKCLFLVPFAYF